MIDTFEKTSIQDLNLAKLLGVDLNQVEELSLHHMRLEMQRKAFEMRDKGLTISQKEANILNSRLQQIIWNLEENYDYDQMCDYMINFNSFVKENSYFNCFSW